MKKATLVLLALLSWNTKSFSQILCVQCYDQNEQISPNAPNFISNGSFENGCPSGHFCPNSLLFDCSITDWTASGGGIWTYAKTVGPLFSKLPDGIIGAYFGNAFCTTCSLQPNDTSCITQSGCEVTGIPIGLPVNEPEYGGNVGVSLEQTVSGLTIGAAYVLEFWVGGESEMFITKEGLFAVDMGFGNTFLRNRPTEDSLSGTTDSIGTRYLIQFLASNSSHTFKFTNWGHICAECTELLLDDVKLYPIANLSPSATLCLSGVDEPDLFQITIGPNPAADFLTVDPGDQENLSIDIFDVTAHKCLRRTINKKTEIDIRELSSGLYMYVIQNQQGILQAGKIIKSE